ncbi:MAG: SDR family oxidoreductase [Spirochaetales bacterium]|nr:SDR family oxidoreductase [Spirochaetales bacterium]
MKIKNYEGKSVFLTGGSEGIGLALAQAFAKEGAHVVLFSRSEDKLKKAVAATEKVKKNTAQRIGSYKLDVTNEASVKKVLGDAVREYGVPDVFVNNAGRSLPNYFEQISSSQMEEIMRVNLYGIWYILSAILPQMKAKGGYVVNTSSMSGFMGVFGYADYTASKFAVIGLTEVLRSEYLKHNITFSVLCPSDIDTPGFKEENKHKPPETMAATGNAKLMRPEAVARACLKGMKKGKFVIIPGGTPKIGYFIKRHWPGLLMSMFDGDIKKAQKKMAKGI